MPANLIPTEELLRLVELAATPTHTEEGHAHYRAVAGAMAPRLAVELMAVREENERMRRDAEDLRSVLPPGMSVIVSVAELSRLRAENARMREALARFGKWECELWTDGCAEHSASAADNWCDVCKAKEALRAE